MIFLIISGAIALIVWVLVEINKTERCHVCKEPLQARGYYGEKTYCFNPECAKRKAIINNIETL